MNRIDVADVLRGLAVMGIITLHAIEHFNFYSYPDTSSQCGWLNFTDKAVWDGLFFMLGGKAYAIFALLFGFSFFIQDNNQRLRGNDFRLRFCWRLVLLFIIGNINAIFFTAEILVLYSLLGFVLVLTSRLSDKWVLWLASILLIQPLHLYYLICALINPVFTMPLIPTGALWDATFNAQNTGTFLEMVKVNLWEGQLASLAWAWDHGRFFQTAALFLLGMLIGRKGLFLKENIKVWNKVLAGSLIAFFPLYGLGNMLPNFIEAENILTPLLLIIKSLSNLAFMLIMVSGILLAFYKTNLKSVMMKITPYGKMSLTNYIIQSIFGALIFYNWGFALHSTLGITGSFLVGIAFFIIQFYFCRWWISKHQHGPIEYLWKRATWLK